MMSFFFKTSFHLTVSRSVNAFAGNVVFPMS
jgi:hypothetical protein